MDAFGCLARQWDSLHDGLSASKSCGTLDTLPAAIFTRVGLRPFHEFTGERMGARPHRLLGDCRSISWGVLRRDASEKMCGASQSHFVLVVASDLKRRTKVRAFKRSAWSPSTLSRFSNLSCDSTLGRNTAFAPGASCSRRLSLPHTTQHPRDAPPRDNCTVHPTVYAHPPSKRSVVPTLRTARSAGRGRLPQCDMACPSTWQTSLDRNRSA